MIAKLWSKWKAEPDDLHKFGLIPEFVGRLPVIAPIAGLSQDDLVKILTEPDNALCKQYTAQFRFVHEAG